MRRLIAQFLEKFRKWTNTAAERAGEISKAAANKAELLSMVGKLKLDVYQLEREKKRLLADLGLITYDALQGAGADPLQQLTGVEDLHRRIAELTRNIDQKTAQIERASHLDEPVHESSPKGKPPGAKKKTAKKPAVNKAATQSGDTKQEVAKKKPASKRKKATPKKPAG